MANVQAYILRELLNKAINEFQRGGREFLKYPETKASIFLEYLEKNRMKEDLISIRDDDKLSFNVRTWAREALERFESGNPRNRFRYLDPMEGE